MAELKGGSTVGGYTIWHRGNLDPASFLSSGGNAATASKLQTARTINGVAFDGTANITIADSTKLPLTGGTLTGAVTFANGTWNTVGDDAQFGDVNQAGIIGIRSNNIDTHVGLGFYMQGAATTAPTALLKVLSTGVADLNVPLNCSQVNGNAATATKLQTARTINGVSFDGTANINLPLIGYGQTWKNVTSSRLVNGTVYTNSTGKPIQVMVSFFDWYGVIEIKVGGVIIASIDRDAGAGAWSYSFIVPAGSTYSARIDNPDQMYWSELS